ncbi:myb-like protein AA [Armigeres subalbatus]|uniref:myb-like protein AA n=1 Tax=Armigeres subalbatus TaxID=124917 RepID=UPI002ED134C4
MNTSEFPTSINRNSPKHDFPLHNNFANNTSSSSSDNGGLDYHNYPSPGSPGGTGPPPPPPGSAQQQDLTIDGIPNNFPHRRSRASRTFKNPPQPHMCIKEKTIDGKEVFINVLSWTRIANPDNPEAPIPLYGGMKVGKIPPGSPRMPPLVYAVMANPEVLKKAGRKCPDTPERMNLVDLMCEFVEAVNPTLHLSRKPEILKDRDLSGELKDVWSAVQACRDKGRVDSGPPENLVVYTEFGPDTAPSYEQSQQQQLHQQRHQPQQPHLHYQQQDDFQIRLGPSQYDHTPSPSPYEQQAPHFHHHGRHIADDSSLSYDPHNSPSNIPLQAHKHQQSAIINNSIESNSEKHCPCDVPDSASSEKPLNIVCSIEDLSRETESLSLSPTPSSGKNSTKSNGLTLPTGNGEVTSSFSSDNTAATSPSSSTVTSSESSNPVPVASKQQTSPTSPTQQQQQPQQTATVSPTAAAPPAPQKETKNSSSHNFFPMFRSSKSSSNSDKSLSNNLNHNDKDKDKDGTGGSDSSPAPDTPVKTSSKKSGLNFFRRNKSSESKKEQPSTPTKQVGTAVAVATQQQQQPTTAENNKLNLLVDESLMHHHHHHHHHIDGNNGTAEIIENSSATIAAK